MEHTYMNGAPGTARPTTSKFIARTFRERGCSDMNPYTLVGAGLGTAEATLLSQRLSAWHDAMVAHERRLGTHRADDRCAEDCAHVEARELWAEALRVFGDRAHELSFLRSRATDGTARRPAARRRQPMLRRHSDGIAAQSQEA